MDIKEVLHKSPSKR